MKRAFLFISYHPGSLIEYERIKELVSKKFDSILVMCKHPYVTEEIISLYKKKFSDTIVLPEIDYKTNVLRGVIDYCRFTSTFNKKISSVINALDHFYIISDGSAYLNVNALISILKKNTKCQGLISIRGDYHYPKKIDILRTWRARLYTTLFKLNKIYADKFVSYKYYEEPRDMIIRLLNPYEKPSDYDKIDLETCPKYYVRSLPRKSTDSIKDEIIFYTDTQLEVLVSALSKKEYDKKLKEFFETLTNYYKNCRIICKPHPMDKGRVPAALDGIPYELYSGTLTSQMHIRENIERIKACYSISSTSLLYAAAQGIPSYTLYKFLEFNGKYPAEFFEKRNAASVPFLYHIRSKEEIGKIDDFTIEPQKEEGGEIFPQLMEEL